MPKLVRTQTTPPPTLSTRWKPLLKLVLPTTSLNDQPKDPLARSANPDDRVRPGVGRSQSHPTSTTLSLGIHDAVPTFRYELENRNQSPQTSLAGGPSWIYPPIDVASPPSGPKTGDILQLDGLGGEFEVADGLKATLRDLVGISVGGIVLFTHPRQTTSGIARLGEHIGSSPVEVGFTDVYPDFREDRDFHGACQDIRRAGFALYGLYRESDRANATFRAKHSLPYGMICDQDAGLLETLGFVHSPSNNVLRGVVVINKIGKVLASVVGRADATIDAVRPLMAAMAMEEFNQVV